VQLGWLICGWFVLWWCWGGEREEGGGDRQRRCFGVALEEAGSKEGGFCLLVVVRRMEPVIKLRADEKVALEGWMFKKRAGFDDDDFDDESAATGSSMSEVPMESFTVTKSQLTATGKKLEALLMRKGEKKRYFVLTTATGEKKKGLAPRALLFYCSRKPKFVRDKELPDDPNMLVVQSDDLDFVRFARNTFQQEMNHQLIRGRLILNSSTTDVFLVDSGEIKIVVPGKTLVMRPAEKTLAEAKLTAGQWYAGLRRAIKDVWMEENRTSQGVPSFGRQKSIKSADSQCPDSLEGVLKSTIYRRHFEQFCEYRHGAENLHFFDKVTEFEDKLATTMTAAANKEKGVVERMRRMSGSKQVAIPKDVRLLGREILDYHVKEGAPEQVNLSDGSRRRLMDSFKEHGDRCFTPDFFDKAKSEIFALMETNYFLRFFREEMAKTGVFSSIYAQKGMNGYEAVIAHFGLVKTELYRFLESYTTKLAQVKAEEEILRDALHVSHDVAVPSLLTTRDALLHLYRTDAVRLQAFDEYGRQLDEQVIFPLTWLSKAVQIQLDTTITGDNEARERVNDARALVDKTKRLEQDLKTIAQYKSMNDLNRPEVEELVKRHNVNVEIVDDQVKQVGQEVARVEHKSTQAQQDLEDRIVSSLDGLERLEIHRLESQQRAVRAALLAEKELFDTLRLNQQASEVLFANIDPPSDMLSFIGTHTEKLRDDDVQSTAALASK